MSEVALVNAVAKKLRTTLSDRTGDHVRVSFEGQPFPHSGQWFVGVAENGFSNQSMSATGLDELYSVKVVITFKMAYSPKKDIEELMAEQGQMRDMTRKVVTAIHQQWDVIGYANTELGNAVNGFIECLRFSSATPVQTRGGDWVWSDSDNPPSVYVRELTFINARRIQTLESMT